MTTYSSTTNNSADHSGCIVGAKTLEEMRTRAMETHMFMASQREPGTTITTKIEELCSACDGVGRIPGKAKKRTRFAPWYDCKACNATGTARLVETIVTTIAPQEA